MLLRGDFMYFLIDLVYSIGYLFPDGVAALIRIFCYGMGVIIMVGVISGFLAVVNHVKGLVVRV